ncbi:MAG: FkbM family methyltransferase [Chloroflexota bacterium]
MGRFRSDLWESLDAPIRTRWLENLDVLLYPGDEISRSIFATGLYEPSELYFLRLLLHRGGTFIDVGANQGLYTLFAARTVGSLGKVISIEPSSRESSRLQRAVALNELTNVLFIRAAALDLQSTVVLTVAESSHSGHNTIGTFAYDGVNALETEEVPTVRLDDIVRDESCRRVDFVKIDVEGAEVRVLDGARSMIEKFLPAFLIEVSDSALRGQGTSTNEIYDRLNAYGYRVFPLDSLRDLATSERSPRSRSGNVLALHPNSETYKFFIQCRNQIYEKRNSNG